MLYLVTERCDMGCPHCMGSHTPVGRDMTLHDFKKAVKKVRDFDSVIILTGGEPLMHPNIMEMVAYSLSNTQALVTLTTNGKYLGRYENDLRRFLANPRLLVQISHNAGLYPQEIDREVPKRLGLDVYEDDKVTISLLGRAKVNGMKPYGRKAPMCSNPILVANQTRSFRETLATLNRSQCLCNFTVMPNLDIYLSECRKIKLANLRDHSWEDICFERLQASNQDTSSNVLCENECEFSNKAIFDMVRNNFQAGPYPVKWV